MPQIFRIGPYIVYFWSNENDPLEPIDKWIEHFGEIIYYC